MVGRNGEFDNMFSNTIRALKNVYPNIKLVLVEPYFSNGLNKYKEYFEIMYDSIIVPDELANVYHKRVITARNHWMVDNSDLVIAYVERRSGGAYNAMRYAKEKDKLIINIGSL